MQKRKLLSVGIALALSGNTWAGDVTEKNSHTTPCPADIKTLSEEQKEKLPPVCLKKIPSPLEETLAENQGWFAGGIAAIAAAVGISLNTGSNSHSSSHGSDGGNDGGDNGGHDGGVTTYNNGVTVDKTNSTLTVQGKTWNAAPNGDGTWTLTDPETGDKIQVTAYRVKDESNTIKLAGISSDSNQYWMYDHYGNLTRTDVNKYYEQDNQQLDTAGGSATGAGNAGQIINGDNNAVNNTGDNNATGGGTGTRIDGDGNTFNNSGNTTADGDGSIGIEVKGDNTTVNDDGDITVTGGGTGIRIDGNGSTVNNGGNNSVDGSGSTGIAINGDNSTVNQNGDLLVTGGATGIDVAGGNALVSNNGNITVRDSGSTGVLITGDNATFSNTGTIDSSLEGTGVKVSGSRGTVTLNGNVNVHGEKDATDTIRGATGVSVSGNGNSVAINGAVDVSVTADNKTNPVFSGVEVSGTGNAVTVSGGVNVTGKNFIGGAETGTKNSVAGVRVSGDNSVSISGVSSIDVESVRGATISLAQVSDGGHLVLESDSVLNATFTEINASWFDYGAIIQGTGAGTTIDNYGVINAQAGNAVMMGNSGASVTNSGVIKMVSTGGGFGTGSAMMANGRGSTVTNNGDISIISDQRPADAEGINLYPLSRGRNQVYAMDVTNSGGAAINNGTVTLNGAGTYGIGVVTGTGTNAGTINVDSFIPTLDADGNVTGESYYAPTANRYYYMGAGMFAGSTGHSGLNGVALNTGTINVNNEGIGMSAVGAGTAINQGTINLTADAGITKSADNQLIGMAAFGGGKVINDQSGVINIDADFGQAFYSDGNANNRIINSGTINLGSGVPPEADNSDKLAMKILDGLTLNGNTTLLPGGGLVQNGATTENTGILDTGTGSGLQVEGTFSNSGTLNTGSYYDGSRTQVSGTLNNASTGVINGNVMVTGNGTVNNSGTITQGFDLRNSATLINTGTVRNDASSTGRADGGLLFLRNSAVFVNETSGLVTLDGASAMYLNDNATFVNKGTTEMTNGANGGAINLNDGAGGVVINQGTMTGSGITMVNTRGGTPKDATGWFWNQSSGVVDFTAGTGNNAVALNMGNMKGAKALNDGTMNIHGNNAIAMKGSNATQLINNGTISLGEQGNAAGESGMIAMQLTSGATADALMENNGTINIYADNSYAFDRMGANGRIINNGLVNIEGTGSGLVKGGAGSVEGINGDDGSNSEVHGGTSNRPVDPTLPANQPRNSISYYTVGTSADGSAGSMSGKNMDLVDVKVNTGFTAGTSATTQTFSNVFTGQDIRGEENIQSTTVVWNATGTKNADGNVDVTMTKNAYTDVVSDNSVNSVASALDAGYTNNALYTSLNLETSADVTRAMKQISGSQAVNVARDARILSNRFNMLADTAPVMSNGLAFNAVAKGDSRAELSNDTKYDMLALRQTLGFGNGQSLSMAYGIARLDGNGSASAGNNGIDSGYSQFFGLEHSMPFGEHGLSWNNALRYDVHQFDSNRGINYSGVSEQARADTRQQYLEFRTEGRKTFTPQEGFDITPYAGLKLRHTLDDGYQERGAGDFNLRMSSSAETALDSVAGVKLRYAGKDGWAATATLEGGPNLSYATSGRTASLQGVAGQTFRVSDDQKGGGFNSLAQVGVKYHAGNASAALEAFRWKEDGISDSGLMMNYNVSF
ncbi:hypothetical protein [[Enterobacter] lignolyticus]|uniref:Autotransporter domain-containing protein n=1 Tax=[Enterobacter] lignolyticus TaxID=1334193 RepID=A0A806X651_9ENTR|nr:hypothetical protein [[Enterobacter] lignolyticus]ALR76322.1 hypothetical protein AO703_08440 [[Enterobacter] lignolyticus]